MYRRVADPSAQTKQFVRLETESPLGVRETILHRATHVVGQIGPIHWLQRKVSKAEMLEAFRLCLTLDLWIYELELVAVEETQRGVGFRADADPIEAVGRGVRTIGFDGDFESLGVEGIDEGFVELQEWLASGT